MFKRTLLACIALAVFLSCYLLEMHKVDPQIQKILGIAEIPCFAYLIYYWILLRRQIWGSRASLQKRLLKGYFLLVGVVGLVFVIGGLVIASFAVSRIINESPVDKSGDLTGLWMGVFAVGLGLCAIIFSIIFSKRKEK